MGRKATRDVLCVCVVVCDQPIGSAATILVSENVASRLVAYFFFECFFLRMVVSKVFTMPTLALTSSPCPSPKQMEAMPDAGPIVCGWWGHPVPGGRIPTSRIHIRHRCIARRPAAEYLGLLI
jgi:hypothetical protein